MSDAELDLTSLGERLAALDEPIRTWRAARERAFSLTFEPKVWRPTVLMGRLPRRAAAGTGVGPGPRAAVLALLDEVCGAYARAAAPRCAVIRGVMHEHEAWRLLDQYVARAVRMLEQGARGDWLERGLAAASIDDQRGDWSDWLGALGNLYLAARNAHIDPAPAFQRMAERSNRDGHAAAPASTWEVLAGFEQSPYFEMSILPRLQ
jgi:hypothetical protein